MGRGHQREASTFRATARGRIRLLPADTGSQQVKEALQLFRAQAAVHGPSHMELQLASQPGQAGQSGDGAQFARFAVEHVTGEDVRKKMFLQKGIDDRGKSQDAGRGLDLFLSG